MQALLKFIAAGSAVILASACAPNGSDGGGSKPANAGAPEIAASSSTFSSSCASDMSISDPSLVRVWTESQLPMGRLRLARMQMGRLQKNSADAYVASADAANGFQVHLDCAFVRGTGSSESLSSGMDTVDVIEVGRPNTSGIERHMEVAFQNGDLVKASAQLRPTTSPQAVSLAGRLPEGKIAIQPGVFLTVSVYLTPAGGIDVRTLVEKDNDVFFQRTVFERE